MIRLFPIFLLALFCWASCEKTLPTALPDNELLDGPVEGLSDEENRRFLAGDVAFNDEVFNATTGLGPLPWG